MKKLTTKQENALRVIVELTKKQGYPPTITELAEALGAASRNTAVKYFKILARKGYIEWEDNKARGVRFLNAIGMLDSATEVGLPLVGLVTAGSPILAEENIERYIPVPRSLLRSAEQHFLLRVKGHSMKDAGIFDRDLVVVRSQSRADIGDVVVALMEGEATVKRLAVKNGAKYLHAENAEYPDIFPTGDWSIQGKVVALMRESVQ